jgi:hypothetical protein
VLPSCLPACSLCLAENEENDLMEMAIQALEHGRALTSMEQMVMATGAYGAGQLAGSYGGNAGGILDSETTTPTLPTTQTGLEAGSSNTPVAATPTPAPTPAPAAKSAAVPAHQSAGLFAAGVMAAVFLL